MKIKNLAAAVAAAGVLLVGALGAPVAWAEETPGDDVSVVETVDATDDATETAEPTGTETDDAEPTDTETSEPTETAEPTESETEKPAAPATVTTKTEAPATTTRPVKDTPVKDPCELSVKYRPASCAPVTVTVAPR